MSSTTVTLLDCQELAKQASAQLLLITVTDPLATVEEVACDLDDASLEHTRALVVLEHDDDADPDADSFLYLIWGVVPHTLLYHHATKQHRVVIQRGWCSLSVTPPTHGQAIPFDTHQPDEEELNLDQLSKALSQRVAMHTTGTTVAYETFLQRLVSAAIWEWCRSLYWHQWQQLECQLFMRRWCDGWYDPKAVVKLAWKAELEWRTPLVVVTATEEPWMDRLEHSKEGEANVPWVVGAEGLPVGVLSRSGVAELKGGRLSAPLPLFTHDLAQWYTKALERQAEEDVQLLRTIENYHWCLCDWVRSSKTTQLFASQPKPTQHQSKQKLQVRREAIQSVGSLEQLLVLMPECMVRLYRRATQPTTGSASQHLKYEERCVFYEFALAQGIQPDALLAAQAPVHQHRSDYSHYMNGLKVQIASTQKYLQEKKYGGGKSCDTLCTSGLCPFYKGESEGGTHRAKQLCQQDRAARLQRRLCDIDAPPGQPLFFAQRMKRDLVQPSTPTKRHHP